MNSNRRRAANIAATLLLGGSLAALASGDPIQTVFVIAMENHNWTQPASQTSPGQIFGNPAAPYINSLVTPGNPNASQASYASNYLNTAAGVHPSEPNYIWAEGGSNFGNTNDNDPYSGGGIQPASVNSLSNQLQVAGKTWRSYQEDTDINLSNNTVVAKSQYTVPLTSASGTFTSGTNQYNGSNQYNYAVKHNPQAFFTNTNGGNDASPSNPMAKNYAPLQQLASDLANNTVAKYNWITPDQYNDMHSTLTGGFTYHGVQYTGDQASIAQGDNFLAQIVPEIMGSSAYKNNGMIVLWWDESEGGDDPSRTIPEIILSPEAKGNAYNSTLLYTHSSDLKTMEELFGLGCLQGACSANDLSDMLVPGAIPNAAGTAAPEPATVGGVLLGAALIAVGRFRRKKA